METATTTTTTATPSPPLPDQPPVQKSSLSKKDSFLKINKVTIAPGVSLEGDELEDYCKKRGLCPLCARTRTRKRVFKLFKKNKWEALTIFSKNGNGNGEQYLVYRGYCVQSECFTLEQAKRMAGETSMRRKAARSARSVMKGLGDSSSRVTGGAGLDSTKNGSAIGIDHNDWDAESQGRLTHSRNPAAFPPNELKNTTNFEVKDGQPLFVIEKTIVALKEDSSLITILDLSSLAHLRTLDLQALAAALKVNTTLSCLILENCKLNDEMVAILAEGLDEAKDIPLTKLYLRTNMIGDAGVDSLCPFLEASVTLEKFDVSRNSIGSMGGVTIFNAFHRNRLTRIRCINLSHNVVWNLDEKEFGVKSFLSRNRSLRVLNLEGNYIHDEGVEAVARGIAQNDQTAMERLYLGWNTVGDDGTIALATMLENNTSMRILGLGENVIKNPGARALLASMDVNTSLREISGLWRNQIDRRFLIVAIRRLLLSADRGDFGTDFAPPRDRFSIKSVGEPIEQAPVNGESEFDSAKLSIGMMSQMSSLSADPDFADPSNSHFVNEPEARELQKDMQRDSKVKPLGLLPSRPSPERKIPERKIPSIKNVSNLTLEPLLEPLEEEPPFDRLSVFQSAPLAYFDRELGVHKGIPLQDFKHEASVLEESLSRAVGAKIEVVVEAATIDRFSSFFAETQSHVMHFSCYGHPDHLPLENGYGSVQTLPVDGLRRLMAAVGSNLRVVFVSSCFSLEIGQAFVDAGIPHVICCQREEGFRDPLATDFMQSFYTALAGNKMLNQAFTIAQKAATVSAVSKNLRLFGDRFQLLPEAPHNKHYHEVPVFFTHQVSPIPTEDKRISGPRHLPRTPFHFLGREVDMYEMLEAIRVDDVVRITGPPGNGKDSVVAAVCNYALDRRKTFSVDDIFWLPAPEGVVPEEDSLYGDLCLCVNILKDSRQDIWDSDDTILECRERIEIELEEMQVVLVVDDRGFSYRGAQEGLEKFISHLLNVANAKVILITSRSNDTASSISAASATLSVSTSGSRIEEANVEIGPLDFKSTATLFGGLSKFITSSACPAAHSASEFAELVEPSFISRMPDPSIVVSQRRSDLYYRMGSGLPSAVISAANNMPKKDFIELIGIANRPEVFVDCLGALDTEIRRRTQQKTKAIEERNYMRAMDLDIILEELQDMRPEFPSLDDLREEESMMKDELADAVASRKYGVANDLKRELLTLKKKIMKEQRLLPDNSQDPNGKLNEFQAQVQSILDRADSSGAISKSANFMVNCGDRDCSFVIYSGDVLDFEHDSEAMGIVCWANESCELEGTAVGEKLVEYGGPELLKDISTLPVVLSTPYGPVRCGTGNAVIMGPEKYGKLEAPCVILTVGPLSPKNLEDALEDDTDSLHYIKIMLRSCYRSSLVLSKHAELQALALSLLTTRKTGQAYEETLRVGLQTLLEEVKFSHLRDLHIVASSQKEASILIAMLSDMGHQQVDYSI